MVDFNIGMKFVISLIADFRILNWKLVALLGKSWVIWVVKTVFQVTMRSAYFEQWILSLFILQLFILQLRVIERNLSGLHTCLGHPYQQFLVSANHGFLRKKTREWYHHIKVKWFESIQFSFFWNSWTNLAKMFLNWISKCSHSRFKAFQVIYFNFDTIW